MHPAHPHLLVAITRSSGWHCDGLLLGVVWLRQIKRRALSPHLSVFLVKFARPACSVHVPVDAGRRAPPALPLPAGALRVQRLRRLHVCRVLGLACPEGQVPGRRQHRLPWPALHGHLAHGQRLPLARRKSSHPPKATLHLRSHKLTRFVARVQDREALLEIIDNARREGDLPWRGKESRQVQFFPDREFRGRGWEGRGSAHVRVLARAHSPPPILATPLAAHPDISIATDPTQAHEWERYSEARVFITIPLREVSHVAYLDDDPCHVVVIARGKAPDGSCHFFQVQRVVGGFEWSGLVWAGLFGLG